jgi:LEA14-like dessication related protein
MFRSHSLWGVVVILPAVMVASGCGMLDQKPSASVTGVSLQDVNLSDATLAFDVEVTNPYAVPLPLVDLDYALSGRGKRLISGEAPLTGTVGAQGSKTVQIPAKVVFREVLTALSDFRPGSVLPYTAEMGLSVDTPVLGSLRLPLRREGELPVPTAPGVKLTRIQWDKLTLSEASGVVELAVTNRNQFAMDLRKLTTQLKLAGTQVADTGIEKSLSLAGSGDSGTLRIPISFSAAKVGLGLFRMLTGSQAGYSLTGQMDVDTPYAPMSIPISSTGTVPFSR